VDVIKHTYLQQLHTSPWFTFTFYKLIASWNESLYLACFTIYTPTHLKSRLNRATYLLFDTLVALPAVKYYYYHNNVECSVPLLTFTHSKLLLPSCSQSCWQQPNSMSWHNIYLICMPSLSFIYWLKKYWVPNLHYLFPCALPN